MPYDDSQSISSALLREDAQISKSDKIDPSMSSALNIPTGNNVKWTIRNSISSASLNRYRSSFRRNGINNSSINSQCSTISFPLFRQFYLMRSSLKQKRQRLSRKKSSNDESFVSEKFHGAPLIEIKHVIITMFITITSAFVLIFMILLDFAYLNDSIPYEINHKWFITNNNALCFRYPKVCVMKGLVIIVFILTTIILCYSILTLYFGAKRHSRLLQQKTNELEKEKCLTEKLLHQILPPCVAKDLINGRKAPAEHYDSVTVYFSDIVGFTSIASNCSPNETCNMLNQLYSIFDSLLENFDVYKVETIGDAYMVVSGAPEKNGDKHPNEIVNMSLSLLRGKQQVYVPRTFAELKLRVGIHTGPVCAAVIGSKMPRYCLFGDTVNVANRMESTGLPERIHLSDDTYKLLKDREHYVFEERGEIEIKGKGLMRTYFLLDIKSNQNGRKSRTNTIVHQDV
ncbi:unnamed protein product [Rotaria magnacalcarata]|uniref:Guanylate cyclase domain-containing protein n=1 Tax=Rotaria magnacalcarata TaxID=392030 RepID=A0A816LYI1_9BILA|nr:unnamed protein product [Rotaria magnacalcarata]CAF2153413.1 unnamed protein product [Rotaria magnacalcarata]CAF3908784.1 unnamed protein product [Rotaria magnacalcarata]CAF4005518.1 unnamed protein product [Rotaria magnacalcarata]